MNKHNMHLVTNIVLFQATWFSLVMGSLLWSSLLLLVLVIHAAMSSENIIREAGFVVCVVLFGIVSDSLMMAFKVYSLPSDYILHRSLIPSWLILLWVAFACSLKHSLNWMFGMPKLMPMIIMIAGPVSYYAGSKLNPERIDIEIALLHWVFFQWALIAFILQGLHLVFYGAGDRKESKAY